MMEYAMLASGSKGNCFLIRDGTSLIMIDCGTTRKYLKEWAKKYDLNIGTVIKVPMDGLIEYHSQRQVRFEGTEAQFRANSIFSRSASVAVIFRRFFTSAARSGYAP